MVLSLIYIIENQWVLCLETCLWKEMNFIVLNSWRYALLFASLFIYIWRLVLMRNSLFLFVHFFTSLLVAYPLFSAEVNIQATNFQLAIGRFRTRSQASISGLMWWIFFGIIPDPEITRLSLTKPFQSWNATKNNVNLIINWDTNEYNICRKVNR